MLEMMLTGGIKVLSISPKKNDSDGQQFLQIQIIGEKGHIQ
jgi:hypothetical protein